MSQVHDNIISAYQVDFENDILILKTQYHNNKGCEKTDIVFSGYLTHIFENEMKNSIILDVEEYPLTSFYEAEHELIEKRKNYGWPIAAYDTKNDLIHYLQLNQYKAFQISSSLGLCGWVLAKQLDILTIE